MSRRTSSLRTLDLAYIALFSVLIAVCAWISIPFFTVPFTLQTFAVFAALLTLGGRRGFYAVTVYLLMGAVGLPVFSGFRGGLGVLLGATGGYILGFLSLALVFWLISVKFGTSLTTTLLACTLGMMVCYAFGTTWFLAVYTGSADLSSALTLCVFPFILPDFLKLSLAFLLSRRVKKYIK